MARSFIRPSNTYLIRDLSTLAFTTYPYTISVNFNHYSNSGRRTIFWYGVGASSNQQDFVEINGSKFQMSHNGGGSIVTTNSLTLGCHHALALFGPTSISIYLDGVLQGTAATANTPPAYDRIVIGARNISTNYFDSFISDVGVWNTVTGWTTDEINALAGGMSPFLIKPANLRHFWAFLENSTNDNDVIGARNLTPINGPTWADDCGVASPLRSITLVTVGVAKKVKYSYTPTGGIVVDGAVSIYRWGTTFRTSGGGAFNAYSSDSLHIPFSTTAGATLAASAPVKKGLKYTAIGGIIVDGTALAKPRIPFVATGGIIIGGTAIAKKHLRYTSTDGIIIGGTALARPHYRYIASANIIIGGTAIAKLHLRYVATGGIRILGQAGLQEGITYVVSGNVRIGIAAITVVRWGTSYIPSPFIYIDASAFAHTENLYISVANIVIGFTANATYTITTLHLTYISSGGISILGQSGYVEGIAQIVYGHVVIGFAAVTVVRWGTSYIPIFGIHISGASNLEERNVYTGSATIIIGGTSRVDWGTSYTPQVTVHVFGQAGTEEDIIYIVVGNIVVGVGAYATAILGVSYRMFGGIIIGGTSRADWGTSYIPVVTIYILGTGRITEALNYIIVGAVVIGFGALSQVDWGTTYYPVVFILINVQSGISYELSYYGISSITVYGYNTADWGTTYYVVVSIAISGNVGVEEALNYITVGFVIVGFGAVSEVAWYAPYTPVSFVITIGGSADQNAENKFIGNASIIISGSSLISWYAPYYPVVYIIIRGSSGIEEAIAYLVVGSIALGIAAYSQVDWGTSYTPVVAIILSGDSGINFGTTGYIVLGGIIVYGTFRADWGTSYTPVVNIYVFGTVIINEAIAYIVTGLIEIGIDAYSQVNWGTSYIAGAVLVVAPQGSFEYGIQYIVVGAILINGASIVNWYTSYVVTGAIYILGSSGVEEAIAYIIVGSIVIGIGAVSVVSWGTSYIAGAVIVFLAQAGTQNGNEYVVIGGIIVYGTSRVDWGTSYTPTVTIIVVVHGQISEAINYVIVGAIVIGFGAYSEVDWGTSYIAGAVIVFLAQAGTQNGNEYVTIGGIIVYGTSQADWGTSYIPVVTITLIGSSGIDEALNYIITGLIIVGIHATAFVSWGTDYTYLISGAIIVSGTSQADWGTSYIPVAVIYVLGSSEGLPTIIYVAISSIIISGTSRADWGTSYIPVVTIILLGENRVDEALNYITDGFIVIGFNAISQVDWGTSYITGGAVIVFLSNGQSEFGIEYIIIGGVIVDSTARADWGTSYIPVVMIIFSGNNQIDEALHYITDGFIIIGIDAYSQVDWGTSYIAGAVIVFLAQAGTQNGNEHITIGGITISGTFRSDWGTSYIPVVAIYVLGSSGIDEALHYIIDGFIVIGFNAISQVDWGTSYIAGAVIIFRVVGEYQNGNEYVVYGGIIIGGTSRADWGTSYIPVVTIILSGENRVGEALHYITDGFIIIGFNAFSQVDWGTSYIAGAVIVFLVEGESQFGIEYIIVGGIIVDSTSHADWYVSYIPVVTITLLGENQVDEALNYIIDGFIVVGFNAISQVDWGTSYISGAVIVFLVEGESQFGIEYIIFGGIIVDSTSHADWYVSYIQMVTIIVYGDNTIDEALHYIIDGFIIIGFNATSQVDWGTSYIAGAVIVFLVIGEATTYTEYFVLGGIIVDSYSIVDWGASYISVVTVTISGENNIDEAIHYIIVGAIIVGFGSYSQVDWGTSYIAGAIIILTPVFISENWGGYIIIGGIIVGIGAVSQVDWGTSSIAGSVIVIVVHASYTAPLTYIMVGAIIIGSLTTYAWGTSCIPTGGIILCCNFIWVYLPILIDYTGMDTPCAGFVVIDTDSKFTITPSRIGIDALDAENFGDFWHRIYCNYGTGYFGTSFLHEFEAYVDTTSSQKSYIAFWALSNNEDSLAHWIEHDNQAVGFFFFNNRFCIHNFEDLPSPRVSSNPISRNTLYYISIIRYAGLIEARIYTDLARTQLFQVISTILVPSRTYRYLYLVNNADEEDPDDYPFTGYVQNLSLGEFAWFYIRNPNCDVGADADWGASLIGGGLCTIGGSSEASHTVESTVGIILGSTTIVKWAVSYQPDVGFTITPDAQINFNNIIYFGSASIIVGGYGVYATGEIKYVGTANILVLAVARASLHLYYTPDVSLHLIPVFICGRPTYVGSVSIIVNGQNIAYWGTTYYPVTSQVIPSGYLYTENFETYLLGNRPSTTSVAQQDIYASWSFSDIGGWYLGSAINGVGKEFGNEFTNFTYEFSAIINSTRNVIQDRGCLVQINPMGDSTNISWKTRITSTPWLSINFKWASIGVIEVGPYGGPWISVGEGTKYYYRVSRFGNSFTLQVYYDSGFSSLVGTATDTVNATQKYGRLYLVTYPSDFGSAGSQFSVLLEDFGLTIDFVKESIYDFIKESISLNSTSPVVVNYNESSVGGIIVRGSSRFVAVYSEYPTALIVVDGDSTILTLHYTYYAGAIIGVSGSTTIDWATAYEVLGSVIIGVNANTIISSVSYYETVGHAEILVNAITQVVWFASWFGETNIIINSYGIPAWGTQVSGILGIVVDGSLSEYRFGTTYLTSGSNIVIGGFAYCLQPLLPTGGFLISGNSACGVRRYNASVSGGIIVNPVSRYGLILPFNTSVVIYVIPNARVGVPTFDVISHAKIIIGGSILIVYATYNYEIVGKLVLSGSGAPMYVTYQYGFGSIKINIPPIKGYDVVMEHWYEYGLGIAGAAIYSVTSIHMPYEPTYIQNYNDNFITYDNSGTVDVQAKTIVLNGMPTDTAIASVYQPPTDHAYIRFTHRFDAYVDPLTDANARIGWWALSQTPDSINNWIANTEEAVVVGWDSSNIFAMNCHTGQILNYSATAGVTYSFVINRDLDHIQVWIYNGLNLLSELEVAVDIGISYGYMLGLNAFGPIVPLIGALTTYYFYGVLSSLELLQAMYLDMFGGSVIYNISALGVGEVEIKKTDTRVWPTLKVVNIGNRINLIPGYDAVLKNRIYNAISAHIIIGGSSDLYVTYIYEIPDPANIKLDGKAWCHTDNRYIYESEGFEIHIGGNSAITRVYGESAHIRIMPDPNADCTILSLALEWSFGWHFNRSVYMEQDFAWGGGQPIDYWYRIETYCTRPTCDVGLDPNTCGPNGSMNTMFYIVAKSLQELCTKLSEMAQTNPVLRWPIKSIKQYSVPVYTSDFQLGDNYCTEYIEQDVNLVNECLAFTLFAGINIPNVHGGAFTLLMADTAYRADVYVKVEPKAEAMIKRYQVAGKGGLVASGSAIIIGWYYYTGTSLIKLVGSYDETGHYYYVSTEGIHIKPEPSGILHNIYMELMTTGGGFTEVSDEEIVYQETTTSDTIGLISIAPIQTECMHFPVPLILTMTHNFDERNVFANFLNRNGLLMNNLTLKFEPIIPVNQERVWRANLHYVGRGLFSEVEKWSFTFEWVCTNSIADVIMSNSTWMFSATIMRELAVPLSSSYIATKTRKKLDITKILAAFDSTTILSNETLDLSFVLNTYIGLLQSSPYMNVVYNVISDNIGMFSSPDWNSNPLLNIGISQLLPNVPGNYYDISGFVPV